MAMMNLSEQDLKIIFGGLCYLGVNIDRSKTVGQLCEEFPFLREKLGELGTIMASATVQQMIDFFGEDYLQGMFKDND